MPKLLRGAIGAIAYSIFLAAAVPNAVSKAAALLSQAARHSVEKPEDSRRRVFGISYVNGVEQIRRDLPDDAAYLLVNASRTGDSWVGWLRYDLAPRRALSLGSLKGRDRRELALEALGSGLPVVVISVGDGAPPQFMSRSEFLRRLTPDRPYDAR